MLWQQAIVSLVTISTKWDSVMASLFFVALLAGGSWFLTDKCTQPTEKWLTIWVVLIATTAVNLLLSARLVICERLGEVGQVARLRLLQSNAGYALLWVLLVSGAALWAAAAIPVSSLAGTVCWLRRRLLAASLNVTVSADSVLDGKYTYSRDIFPLQWRIALTWAGGYFIFSFLTPVVFAKQDEVEVGWLGLGLTIFSAISTVGMSSISAKIPAFAAYTAGKGRAEESFSILALAHCLGEVLYTSVAERSLRSAPPGHVEQYYALDTSCAVDELGLARRLGLNELLQRAATWHGYTAKMGKVVL